jgi:hypothetical protein
MEGTSELLQVRGALGSPAARFRTAEDRQQYTREDAYHCHRHQQLD